MIEFEKLSNDAKKENILRYTIQMSKVDGELSFPEYSFLRQLAESLNYDLGRLKFLILNEDYRLYSPPAEIERMEIILYVFFLIRADNKISKREENMLYEYGLKLGFSNLFMDDLMMLLLKYIDTELEKDAILNEAKKYLN